MKAGMKKTELGKRLVAEFKAAGLTYSKFIAAIGAAGINDPGYRVYQWIGSRRWPGTPALKAIARTLGAPAAIYVLYGRKISASPLPVIAPVLGCEPHVIQRPDVDNGIDDAFAPVRETLSNMRKVFKEMSVMRRHIRLMADRVDGSSCAADDGEMPVDNWPGRLVK